MFRCMFPTLWVALSGENGPHLARRVVGRALQQGPQPVCPRDGPAVHAPHLAHADDVLRGRYRNPSELGFEYTVSLCSPSTAPVALPVCT